MSGIMCVMCDFYQFIANCEDFSNPADFTNPAMFQKPVAKPGRIFEDVLYTSFSFNFIYTLLEFHGFTPIFRKIKLNKQNCKT